MEPERAFNTARGESGPEPRLPDCGLAHGRFAGRARLESELFQRPLGGHGERVTLDRLDLVLPFAARLKNLPARGSNLLLCPLTGMERALHFLTGFFEAVNPAVEVRGISTQRFGAAPALDGLLHGRNYDRVTVFDEECCNTYEGILMTLGQRGYSQRQVRALRLNDPATLHLGSDMCISSVKHRSESKTLPLSAALLEWREGRQIGEWAQPNYGIFQALGLHQFHGEGSELAALAPLYSGSDPNAGQELARFRALARKEGLGADLSRGAVEGLIGQYDLFSDRARKWLDFQRAFAALPAAEFAGYLSLTIAFEESRRRGFAGLGREVGLLARDLETPQRFALRSLPYHWGRWPDAFAQAVV